MTQENSVAVGNDAVMDAMSSDGMPNPESLLKRLRNLAGARTHCLPNGAAPDSEEAATQARKQKSLGRPHSLTVPYKSSAHGSS